MEFDCETLWRNDRGSIKRLRPDAAGRQALAKHFAPGAVLWQAIVITHGLARPPAISYPDADLTTAPVTVKFYCADAGW